MLVPVKVIQEIKFGKATIVISEERFVSNDVLTIVWKELVYTIYIKHGSGSKALYIKQMFVPEVWNNSIKQLYTNIMIGKIKAKLKEEQWKDLN